MRYSLRASGVRVSDRVPLPRLPDFSFDAEPAAPVDRTGFLRLERLRLRIDGGEPFPYDVVTRTAMDAVAIAAHFVRGGRLHVMMVSAVRPPLRWRDAKSPSVLWEVPAGLVEPGEAFRAAAARELFEEVGARVSEDALVPLGPEMFPVPGMIAEVHGYFHVAIDEAALEKPPGDASALERASIVASIPLDEALALCASGEIRDLKTEVVLRRLADVTRAP